MNIKTENYLREFYFILFAQRKTIIWTTALFFILSVTIALFWPPTFGASGSILVRAKKLEKPPEALEEVDKRLFSVTKEDLSSEVQILTSPDVIERTIKYLQSKNLYDKNDPLIEEVYKMQKKLKTEIVLASNVINITYLNKDPEQAVRVLGALLDQYIIYRTGVYYPKEAQDFYSQNADRFKLELETKEKELMGFIGNTRIPDPQKEIDKNITFKKDLEQQLSVLRNESVEKKISILHLENALRNKDIQYFSFIENKSINDLGVKLQDLYIERGKTLRSYSDKSDKVKLIDKQINDVYTSLKGEVNAYKDNITKHLQIVNGKIANIEERIDTLNKRNAELQKQLIELQRITREVKLNEFSYETFAKRREESRIFSNIGASNLANVSIFNKAFPSDGPLFPRKGVVIPLGFMIGFITGCSLGFMREFFDHTFKKPSDVTNYAGIPVVFSIPSKTKRK